MQYALTIMSLLVDRTLVSQKRASTSSVAPSLSVAPLRALESSFESTPSLAQSGFGIQNWRYLAPEILTRSGHGRNVDLYGLGATRPRSSRAGRARS